MPVRTLVVSMSSFLMFATAFGTPAVGNDNLLVGFLLVVQEIGAGEEQLAVAVAVVAVGRLPGAPLDVVG